MQTNSIKSLYISTLNKHKITKTLTLKMTLQSCKFRSVMQHWKLIIVFIPASEVAWCWYFTATAINDVLQESLVVNGMQYHFTPLKLIT